MSGLRIQSSKLTRLGNWKHEIKDHKENENEQPNFQIAQSCLANVSPEKFWTSQLNILSWFVGLNGGIPWLLNTDGTLCFVCKSDIETLSHFLFICPTFRQTFEMIWSSLNHKI